MQACPGQQGPSISPIKLAKQATNQTDKQAIKQKETDNYANREADKRSINRTDRHASKATTYTGRRAGWVDGRTWKVHQLQEALAKLKQAAAPRAELEEGMAHIRASEKASTGPGAGTAADPRGADRSPCQDPPAMMGLTP